MTGISRAQWKVLITVASFCSAFIDIGCSDDGNDPGEHAQSYGVTVFYPADFDHDNPIPSLALIKEPDEFDAAGSTNSVPQFYSQGGRNAVFIGIEAGTSLYGTGEVTGPLLRNGKSITLWNFGNFQYILNHGKNLYQSHPWVLAVRADGTAYGVIFDTTWRAELELSDGIRFLAAGPPFRVIHIDGQSPQDIMKGLAELTGTIALPPRWALGFQQCRIDYATDSRIREIANEYRDRHIPCDVIWFDIEFMDGYRVFTADPESFPDPEATNQYLHEKGFKTVWTSDPGIKVDPGYRVYDQGTEQDFWVRTANGGVYWGIVWPGLCAFPDFTRPEVHRWWAGLLEEFLSWGMDGIWIDMNEPDIFPFSTMPADNWHRGGGELPAGPHLQYHNVYGMLAARTTWEGMAQTRPDKRPFVLTRSNFLGGQRYAATWTGDNSASWEHLKMSVPMSLNLGLSGQPFSGADIGGFWGEADAELFGHWIALGAFYPFSRAHSAFNAGDQEPWAFGEDIEGVSRTALERRYRLLPYLYTLFREASVTGMPVMRPVFFADPTDPNLRTEDQAFMLGKDLIVVPKWAENLQLPKGMWRSISLVGEDSVNDPYQANLLIREGSILPLGKVIQNTAEELLDPLTLMVCLDENGIAEGVLYEDAGDGYAYQQGEFLLTTYRAEKQGSAVVVTVVNEEGQLKRPERETRIYLVTEDGVTKACAHALITGH